MSKRFWICVVVLCLLSAGMVSLRAANDESEGYVFAMKGPARAEQGEIVLTLKAEVKTPDVSLNIGGRLEGEYELAPSGDNFKLTVNAWNGEGEFQNLKLPVEIGKEIELIKQDNGYAVDFMGQMAQVPVFLTSLFLEHSVGALLPQEKIIVGQSVKVSEEFVRTWLSIEPGYQEMEGLTGDLTLKKVEKNANGSEIATLELSDFSFSVKHSEVGHTMKVADCKGTLLFDLAAGRPVSFEAEAAVSFHGIFGGQETSEGTITLATSFK